MKAKFILEQCEDKIDLRRKKKDAVIALLKARNYDVMDGDEEYKYLRGMRIEQVEEENVAKLLKEKEQKSRYRKMLPITLIGCGVLIASASTPEAEQGGALLIACGLILGYRSIQITDTGKQFEKVKNIKDKNEKEKLAYESLVSLASTSRIKKNEKDSMQRRIPRNSSIAGALAILLVSTALEEYKKNNPEQNVQIQMTIEEKALDNYLTQKIIL